jgi:hypothetical protein
MLRLPFVPASADLALRLQRDWQKLDEVRAA